jgi:minor extracellular serine protease Vpr
MKRNSLFSLALILLVLSATAQTRRTSDLQPPATDSANPVAKRTALQARHRTPRTANITNGRRSAIVVLSASPLVPHLVATAPATSLAGNGRNVDSAAIRGRMFSSEGDTYLKALRDAKAPLIAQFQARGGEVISQAEHVINAVMVHATEEDLVWLRSQPGVQSAEFSKVRRAQLNTATAIIGAPTVWAKIGGAANAGAGIKIGMLDSGIDNSQPMFSGNGFTAPSGFPKTNAAAGTGYTNGKVIVAKNYICTSTTFNTSCPNSSTTNGSTYDHSAADGYGHGTGTSATAAGVCVSSAPLTPGANLCGVAPGAYLGNYKVCDSTGSCYDAAFLQAINDAVADGMNVLNYSVGGDPGGELPNQSSDYQAIQSAMQAGVPITISAGNCGPNAGCYVVGDNSIQDPGVVPDAITVGGTSNSHVADYPVTVTASVAVPSNLQTISSYTAPTPSFNILSAAVIVDVATLDSTGFGCNALPGGSLSGKIALMRYSYDLPCDQSEPDVTKINNAQAAGAVGVIMIDNVLEELSYNSLNYLNGSNIPSTMISYVDGGNLQAFVDANPGIVKASINNNLSLTPKVADQEWDYSSRGPQNDFTIKPDLVAPADAYMPSQQVNPDPVNAIYDPSGYMWNEGTSYSAPMTAGSAAILKQQRPTLTAYDIKSALANTGSPILSTQDGAVISVQMTGGGRLNLPAALATTLVSNPVSISFGQVATPASGYTQSQSVTLKGVGTTSETFSVAVNQGVSNAALTVSAPASINVTSGGTATLTVTMSLNAALQGIFEGNVVLTSTSTATSIHIPYWMILGMPSVPANGLVDGAGFNKTVSPGDIVSLFGTTLGTAGVGASIVPLPFDVNHTVVSITGTYSQGLGLNEFPVALYYSSSGQVNFQVPFLLETTRNATLNIYLQGVEGNSTINAIENQAATVPTLSIRSQLAAVSPGMFTASGTAVVTHASGALVTAANPATVGEVVIIYCAGMGATNPFIYDGDPGPVPPATTTAAPTVSIGGTNASIQFSGMSPFFVGLYQINAQIATGTPTGSQPISISISGATSNSATTYLH